MRALSTLIITLMLFGCATPPKKGASEIKDVDPKRYKKTLERYSAEERVYANLETKLLVTAVYRSWSYRDAYVDEVARREVMPRTEREEMKTDERADWEIYHSFVITAYTPETKHNALSLNKNAVWKLRLYDDKENFTEAVVVDRIDLSDKTFEEYLPSNLWGRTYIVKFPREELPPQPKVLTLQIASALGVAELGYDLAGEPTPEGAALQAIKKEAAPAEIKAEAEEDDDTD